MTDTYLQNCHIMIVEDEYFVASGLRRELTQAGAVVVGPVPSVKAALALIEQTPSLNGALLDLNLGGEPVFPVADKLMARGVPFVFATGYQKADIPARYAHAPQVVKPFEQRALASALVQMLKAT
jgi:CheY-like chemotaxis protein